MTFTLINRPTMPFRVIRYLTIAGIPCVLGHTLDGRFQTTARLADVMLEG